MSTASWRAFKLDELGRIARGRSRHRPRNDPSLYGGPYPFFQTGDIKTANFYLKHAEQTYNEKGLAQSQIWPKGTLCITIAANIAESAFLDVEGCFPDSVVGFVADSTRADARFVKYSLDTMKRRMQDISRGTTQDNLSLEKLLSFRFLVPPLDIQRRIAGILSAYDDLIEANTRRIAILEEMARRLFDEWFVKFRFPDHGSPTLAETATGPAPKSRPIRTASELIAFDPPTKVMSEGNKPFVPMASLSSSSMSVGQIEMRSGNGGAKFQSGDTLFARITPCLENGKTGFVDFLRDGEVALGSTEFIVMRGRTVSPEWVYLFARTELFRAHAIKSMSGATGRQRVRVESLKAFRVAEPNPKAVEKFTSIVRPMFRAVQVLMRINRNLRAARDLLLPKLISGEIDISSAKRQAKRAVNRAAAE